MVGISKTRVRSEGYFILNRSCYLDCSARADDGKVGKTEKDLVLMWENGSVYSICQKGQHGRGGSKGPFLCCTTLRL